MFRALTPIVKNLLLITVGMHVIASFFLPQLSGLFALYYIESKNFMPFQFVTYMFMHADFWHLFSNMFGLFIFGPLLEQFLGPKKLLILWMVCGVGSGVLYSGYVAYNMGQLNDRIEAFSEDPDPEEFNRFVSAYSHYFNPVIYDFIDDYSRDADNPELVDRAKRSMLGVRDVQANIPMVGASGALFGVLIAFGMLFPNTQLFLLFPPMPIRAKYLVLFYGLYTVYNIFVSNPTDNVAHFAHLSGLLIGAVLVTFWKKDRQSFY
ncbi:rhomboid family intramembrane serine protease [Cyclobacterium marinum]|uniref:Rhomboid family protein n=2 Tax=Cyclobacterium TaxID=68288 RepID=G0IW31_CYCMS|nr:rhomboid family intramembrane serine protease [Cyclobacterium marinum]AEL26251.1 Rhomboid family protein [Cyclobacterium marinum DSM 745]MBI0399594.1 rhomboid family intramembrane serine protease [Cyclobacterium marinum]MBR9773818.1 rhomboid family intramembrane serine protease [Cytophagales bacterium]|tara:strand:+ start:59995 stop:60786 length:792 start_codon:yes stop_codon:yes gene_type:complete